MRRLPQKVIPQIPVMKNSIVDVRCVDASGRQFIVEMQVLWTESTEILQDADIREAVECLQESAFSPAELDAYDRYWDRVRVERTLLADSHAQGEKVGLQKGREEGEQIGLQKGREEGLQEALARMVASGISESDARKMLGLSC